ERDLPGVVRSDAAAAWPRTGAGAGFKCRRSRWRAGRRGARERPGRTATVAAPAVCYTRLDGHRRASDFGGGVDAGVDADSVERGRDVSTRASDELTEPEDRLLVDGHVEGLGDRQSRRRD